MKVNLDQQPLSFFASAYLKLHGYRRKIIQYLRFQYKVNKTNVFPSVRRIAEFARCSEECVHKFFQHNQNLNHLFFKKQARYAVNGRQTSNVYFINKNLINALEWLSIYGFLNAPKKKIKEIILSMENQQKVHPPLPQKVHPLTKDSSYKEKLPEYSYINPQIRKIRIPEEDQIMLSRYPEFAITEAIQDILWYRERGNKIDKPVDLLRSRINHHVNKRLKNNI
jgi:hypothetical protein